MMKILTKMCSSSSLALFVVIAILCCAAEQGRDDDSTSGYPLNYFTSSDDYSGDIEVSHEFYRPTADVSLVEDTNHDDDDSLMSTTINNNQKQQQQQQSNVGSEAFDVSSSSEYDNYYNNHEEELIGNDKMSEKLLINNQHKQEVRKIHDNDSKIGDLKVLNSPHHKTHQQNNAQNSKLINFEDELIRRKSTNRDKIRSCDDSINEKVSSYLKFGNKIRTTDVAGDDDLNIDVNHDVFDTKSGLLNGIIYQGKYSIFQ